MLAQNDFSLDQVNTAAGTTSPANPAELINKILPYIYGAAGLILLIMLITAGYQMIFSRGDPKAMQVAQSKITTSIIGILILFASFWIVKLVFEFLGINFATPLIN